MSVSQPNNGLKLPSSLQTQLGEFRRRVWKIKTIEALCGGLFGIVVSYLFVFACDRMVDTPGWFRSLIFLVAVSACAYVPVYLHRWIWCHRRLEQLARLLSRRYPSIGDQMLGIIELVRNEFEQQRSRALCEAAIQQVSDAASRRDFSDAVPHPRHRLWAWMAGVPAVLALLLLAVFPSAATNAWARFVAPWSSIERFTFTNVERLGEKIIVPHGEAVTIPVRLNKDSNWQPQQGTARLGSQLPVNAELKDGKYEFAFAGQIGKTQLDLRIGDARQRAVVEPMLRPELTHVVAEIHLPEYLQRNEVIHKDIRGGVLTVVAGSKATFAATANRNLVDGNWSIAARPGTSQVAVTSGAGPSTTMSSPTMLIDESHKLQFEWKDEYGLMGREPLTVNVNAKEDEAPTLSCEDLPRNKIIIDSETLTFQVRAVDDFGIKQVGIEWQGTDKLAVSKVAKGDRILAAGASEKEILELTGTFCAKTLGIEPQPIAVRLFVEDYYPGRSRHYSQPYNLFVMNAEQHAIWLTEQLSKWHRMSLEVRDRELQLHHTNQELRMLTDEQLDLPENRKRLEDQATAERSNGRRLTGLVNSGEELVRQAMRNPEFGVGHLEKWAEMLQILKDIAGNRMPSVAELLKQSSQAPQSGGSQPPTPTGPHVGQNRGAMAGTPDSKPKESKPKPQIPTVGDKESTQNPGKPSEPQPDDPNKKDSSPRLTFPVTTVMSPADNKPKKPSPATEKLDEAVKVQQDLLAEFDKIADELNKVLANLEGSTLVKRLKAASRKQYVVAGKIADQIDGGFGRRVKPPGPVKDALEVLSKQEETNSQDLSMIMDDLSAYFERRRVLKFQNVLEEMRSQDAVGSLRQLGDDIMSESGMSIAQAEFWSDTFDRWADDLIDPGCCKCPGCKSKASLPPSAVLEALQILEAEVNLREETRVAEQAKPAIDKAEYENLAEKLSDTQQGLSERVSKLADRIRELPDAETEFGKELKILSMVEIVMNEATEILSRPNTATEAIGAETEAIELLLQSKKINPKSGGGGGADPGGGGTGTTEDVALALVGSGVNEKEIREDRGISQSSGESGVSLPEEFRAGLDEYFNRLERDATK